MISTIVVIMDSGFYMYSNRLHNCNCSYTSGINEFLAGFNIFILFITICMLMYIESINNRQYNVGYNGNEGMINGYDETDVDDEETDDGEEMDDDDESENENTEDDEHTDNNLKRRVIQKTGNVTSYFSFWN